MRAEKPIGQPRAILSEEKPETYRAGLHLELQKFEDAKRDRKRDRQLMLFNTEEPGVKKSLPPTGLNLSVPEDRALAAIQRLLDRTDYKGHERKETEDEGFVFNGDVPVLNISYTDFLEAYGIQKHGGRFHGTQAEQALEALNSLAKVDRHIFYERKRPDGKYDVIRKSCPLIRLTKLTAWKGLKPEERERPPEERAARGFSIKVSPPFIDQLETFFVRKPVSLFSDIKRVAGGRIPGATLQFINWLMTKDSQEVKADRDTLFVKLGLSSYVERRHKKEAEDKLQEAMNTAYTLAYLTEPASQDGTGVYTFRLNPEKCSRIKAKTERREKAEAEKKRRKKKSRH